MQYQIPQFIDTEDKIVGPLSIREFVYLCITFGAVGMSFFLLNFVVWLILSIPVIGLGVALAFVKVNGRPFISVALAAAKFYWRPQIYVWQPEQTSFPKPTSTTPANGPAFSLEKVVSGLALKSALQFVQTGPAASTAGADDIRRRSLTGQMADYQITERITGERHATRRIDYR